jgi:hypothetical protein
MVWGLARSPLAVWLVMAYHDAPPHWVSAWAGFGSKAPAAQISAIAANGSSLSILIYCDPFEIEKQRRRRPFTHVPLAVTRGPLQQAKYGYIRASKG